MKIWLVSWPGGSWNVIIKVVVGFETEEEVKAYVKSKWKREKYIMIEDWCYAEDGRYCEMEVAE